MNRLESKWKRCAWIFITVVVIFIPDLPAQEEPHEPSRPVEMTAQDDHARMMQILNIRELRPGANPNDLNAPNAVNYDEEKATIYPSLPDPLLTQDRKKVTGPEMWWGL